MLSVPQSRNRFLHLRLRSGALLLTVLILLIIVPAAALDLSTDNPPSVTSSISQGDSVYVNGTATVHPQQGLNVWLLGNNYAKVTNIAVRSDNTFEYEIKKADTRGIASGQYFVLIQHPLNSRCSSVRSRLHASSGTTGANDKNRISRGIP